MTDAPDDRVFVRIVRGQVGGRHPEDGTLVLVTAEQAAALISQGDAILVAPDGPTIDNPRPGMTLAAIQENDR